MTTEIVTREDIKQEVLRHLRLGRANAITGQEFAKLLNHPNDRQIRKAIRELIAAGMPIAASVGTPPGYYFAETPEEVNNYLSDLKARLVEDAYRRRDFKLASQRIFGQMKLI